MNIRPITDQDAGRVVEIYKPYVTASACTFELDPPSDADMRARIADITTKFPWLVCEIDDRIVGYAYASAHRSRCAYEWSVESSVYVDASMQQRGVGRALYGELMPLLRQQGVVNVLAGITLPNEASVRLHTGIGFTPIGVFKDIGFKLNEWQSVGWWQLQLQKPTKPSALQAATAMSSNDS